MMRSILAALASIALSVCASAQELRIGERTPPTLDPHFLFLDTNAAYGQHLYEALVRHDRTGTLVPGLAVAWEPVAPNRWRFRLRQGVKFHDGRPFTADDVIFSFRRVPAVPNNPAPYTSYLYSITAVERVDDHTVDFTTSSPNPLLPIQASGILIVAKHAVEGRGTSDFTSGVAAIGTGPYRFVEYRPGERLVVARYDDYWGELPFWSRVTFRVLSNDASRMAALLSGEVDLIDNVPPTDANRLASTEGFGVNRWPTRRVIYLGTNIALGQSPATTDSNGRPLESNPFADVRVRRAVSLAINREAIVQRILGGYGVPTSQLAVEGMNAHLPDVPTDPYSPEESLRLLAAAGYPDGFRTSLQCPNDRYVGDAATCQAIGQMLARIRIRATVELFPSNVYFPRLGPNGRMPMFMVGWASDSADVTQLMIPVFHTYNPQQAMGQNNRTYFSDPTVDALAEQAASELDDARRADLLRRALRIATEQHANIPLYRTMTIVGVRRGYFCHPRADEKIIAMDCGLERAQR